MSKINLMREIREIKTQLSYSKNVGFLFGAGTSCALGIPNIAALTEAVEKSLTGDYLKCFNIIKNDLQSPSSKPISIEDILNQVRRIRDITSDQDDKNYLSVCGKDAKGLDIEICDNIYKIISEKEHVASLDDTKRFFAWLDLQNRDYSKEVFTTNYDLIIEKSLEETNIPYFDGFVGSYEPFFWQDSIDRFVDKNDITKNWIRLWKIHGSLSWFWKVNKATGSHRIVRTGKIGDLKENNNELVIYPSKDKYDSSRKQPFIAYFDRLKNYLINGELLFIFTGYSFSDQHINDLIFNCLRINNRLFAMVFFFKDEEVENLYKLSSSYLNLSVFGPTKAIINGQLGEWEFNKEDLKPGESSDSFWDEAKSELLLGDFKKLVHFIISSSGKKDTIEVIVNGK
ncbi:MAG: SIR2 family protein [Desulfitobacterium sp.]